MTAIDPSVGCILLAAGSAKRFGGGKLFASLGGQPLWEWAAASLESAGFTSRYLVVNAEEGPSPERPGWSRVENSRAHEGIASSIRAGVRAASHHSRIVIALADMPFVDPSHLARLARRGGAIFTRFPEGRPGCPAAFPTGAFPTLCTLRGDKGAASLCGSLSGETEPPPDGSRALFDIDNDADLAQAEIMIRRTPGVRLDQRPSDLLAR